MSQYLTGGLLWFAAQPDLNFISVGILMTAIGLGCWLHRTDRP